MAWPSELPGPVTKLYTPSGMPASRRHSAIRREVQGVSVAGLKTTVLPATRAAPSGPPVNAAGKLNGLMTTQTPYGRSTETLDDSNPVKGSRPNSMANPSLASMREQE